MKMTRRMGVPHAISKVIFCFFTMEPYTSPIPPALYGYLSVMLLMAGIAVTGAFFGYAVGPNKSLFLDIPLASLASVLLGSGTLFLFLWAGIYV